MKIYLYNKNKNTDELIIKSVNEYGVKTNKVFRTERGKPYIKEEAFVGVCHTENIIVIGVANQDFGIDIESINRILNNEKLIREKYFNGITGNIIDLWIRFESYGKFIGNGIDKKNDIRFARGKFHILEIENYKICVYTENNINIDVIDKR